MAEYTLALAFEDFLPVLFSSLGLFWLARMIAGLHAGSRSMAYTGWALITVGGLSKVVYKLILAAGGPSIPALNNALFVFMGPGFTLFSWALWWAQQQMAGRMPPSNVWLRPLALIAIFLVGAIAVYWVQGGRAWVFVLLTLTTFANLALGILLIRQARQQGLRLATALFLVNLVFVFMLNGMARMPNQTVPLQWVEQILNTFSQAAFAYAAWQLARDTARRPDGD